METGSYNISTISKVVYDALSGICENLFLFDRPKSYDDMEEFIIIDFPGRLYDNIGYGATRCVIDLYAKERGGQPNMSLLSSLQDKIYGVLPIETDQYKIHFPVSQIVGSDGLGYHSISIYCNVLIK